MEIGMAKLKAVLRAVGWSACLAGVVASVQRPTVSIPQIDVRVVRPGDPLGEIVTGSNIGFQRIAGDGGGSGTVAGYFMVRINGEWLMATSPATLRPMVGSGRERDTGR